MASIVETLETTFLCKINDHQIDDTELWKVVSLLPLSQLYKEATIIQAYLSCRYSSQNTTGLERWVYKLLDLHTLATSVAHSRGNSKHIQQVSIPSNINAKFFIDTKFKNCINIELVKVKGKVDYAKLHETQVRAVVDKSQSAKDLNLPITIAPSDIVDYINSLTVPTLLNMRDSHILSISSWWQCTKESDIDKCFYKSGYTMTLLLLIDEALKQKNFTEFTPVKEYIVDTMLPFCHYTNQTQSNVMQTAKKQLTYRLTMNKTPRVYALIHSFTGCILSEEDIAFVGRTENLQVNDVANTCIDTISAIAITNANHTSMWCQFLIAFCYFMTKSVELQASKNLLPCHTFLSMDTPPANPSKPGPEEMSLCRLLTKIDTFKGEMVKIYTTATVLRKQLPVNRLLIEKEVKQPVQVATGNIVHWLTNELGNREHHNYYMLVYTINSILVENYTQIVEKNCGYFHLYYANELHIDYDSKSDATSESDYEGFKSDTSSQSSSSNKKKKKRRPKKH